MINKVFLFLMLILILIIVFDKNTYSQSEQFDGIGKSFSTYYHPEPCCQSKNCYPGMYVRYNY